MAMARQRGTFGSRVAVACGLLVALLCGHAKEALANSACKTVTERVLDEIVVPFGDADHPRLPRQAVKLVPGETVCLTGKLDSSGDLQDLEVVADSTSRSGLIIALRLERGERTSLHVRHSSERYLYYDALQLVTEQDVAFPTGTLPVGPGLLGAETWDHGVRKLVLHGFRFGTPPERTSASTRRGPGRGRDTSHLNLSMTFGFWGGERALKLDELERGFARDGYYPLQRNVIMGGLDLDFTFGRVRAGVAFGRAGLTTHQRGTGKELSSGLFAWGFTAGYDLLRFEQLHVFLGTGFGGEELFVDRPQGSTLFPGVQPWEGERVKFVAWQMPFDIGTDYFVPLGRASSSEKWILQFGARLGWVQQLGSGGWKTDADKKPRDLTGPAVDLSGPRARLVLGIGAQNGW
jgi:hypothetical protein